MQKEISFTIDSDVYEKLTMALQLSGEGQETVLENCVKSYTAKTFGAISEEYSPDKKKSVADRDYTGKAIQRIPAWSAKPNQNNHKIIRAFLQLRSLLVALLLIQWKSFAEISLNPIYMFLISKTIMHR